MQEFLAFITPVIQDVLYVVIIGAVTVLSKHFKDYISSKRESMKTETDISIFNNTLADALETVQKVVDTVSQTYVNSLKASGKFTAEEQEKAFNQALESAKNLLNEDSKKVLETAYKDLDAWLKVQIESYILSKKNPTE